MPCQGWGREFKSRFPLRKQVIRNGDLFLYVSVSYLYSICVRSFSFPVSVQVFISQNFRLNMAFPGQKSRPGTKMLD